MPLRAPDRVIALVASSTALLGLLTAATLVAAERDPAPPAMTPVAEEVDERTAALVRASRGRVDVDERPPADPLPACASYVPADHRNGLLPPEALCPLPGPDGHQLRPDAARGLVQLALAYAEWFGGPLCITDSYRSLGAQQALAARKPGLAARPGTSEHGWGLAADLGCGVESYDSPEHRWMAAHAGRFGWGQPDWAQRGGAREEPWHWEYLRAGVAADAAITG